MNVSLTPELDSFVAGKVQSGRYNSASEVVREALRLLEEHDRARSAQIAVFNQELGARLASLDQGEQVQPAAARERIRRKSQERRVAQVR
jgi:antitoxin ParD1/3/4